MILTEDQVWEGIGYLGQAFFFSRGLVQWIASERRRRVVVPNAYWWMSLFGGVLSISYALHEQEIVFILAQAVSLFIYPRNLWLLRSKRPLDRNITWPLFLGLLSVAGVTTCFEYHQKLAEAPVWIGTMGLLGALLWTIRFPLQWWISERRGSLVLPPAFMWVSFFGSALLLVYAIWTQKLVFILGQVLGPVLYGRNLILGRSSAVRAEKSS